MHVINVIKSQLTCIQKGSILYLLDITDLRKKTQREIDVQKSDAVIVSKQCFES